MDLDRDDRVSMLLGRESWSGQLSLQDTVDTIAMLRCQYCILGRDSGAGHLLLAGVRATAVVLCMYQSLDGSFCSNM